MSTNTITIAHAPPARRGASRTPALVVLACAVLAAALLEIASGPVRISPGQTLAILGSRLGLALPWTFEPSQAAVLFQLRLPRALLAMEVGAALAVSGAVLQGLFRNPLVDPGLIGVSSGASLGAALCIVGGTTTLGLWQRATIPVAAFLMALLATALVYRLARDGERTRIGSMLLAGIAVNAVAGAAIGLLSQISTDAQMRNLVFWSFGSLGGATWPALAAVTPFIGLAVAALLRLAPALNALLLGEAEAGHLGVAVERTRRTAILGAALAVGAAVAVSGLIGFVGLVVPHMLRLALGPDHRIVLPGSALLGALLLLLADLLARTVASPAELPIGIVTALIGAPFFLWLLRRERRFGAVA